ncbi:unnamed protein product [Brassica rapa subsp. narinosa]
MTCSEDGILGVIEQGEEPIELLAEPCAINSFDIDRQNPQPRVGVNSNLLKALAYRPVQGTICFWFSSEPQQRNGGWETSLNTQVSVSNTWRKEVGQTATVGPTGTNTWPCKEPLKS